MSWSESLWVPLDWNSLCFLDFCDLFLITLGKFSIITFETGFLSVALLLLLLVSLLYGYYYVSCCPVVPLKPLHSFWVFFPFLALSGCFFLPCLPARWFDPLPHLVCFWFLLLNNTGFDKVWFWCCWSNNLPQLQCVARRAQIFFFFNWSVSWALSQYDAILISHVFKCI